MSAITLESHHQLLAETTVVERDRALTRVSLSHAIGRLMSSRLIEQTSAVQDLMAQKVVQREAVDLVLANNNTGTSPGDPAFETILEGFGGDIREASGYLLDVTAAVQQQSSLEQA